MPQRGLVVPSRPLLPAALWLLFGLQTAIVAIWPGFFVDTLVDGLMARLPQSRGVSGVPARLGARELLIPLALAVGTGLSWRRRSLAPLALLAGSYLLVAGVASATKAGLARPQPLPLPGVPGRAFPSGHAAQAVVVFGAIALLTPSEWRRRAFAVVAGVVAVVSVALLWRRAHWLTDLVGGVALGLACLTTVHAALKWARFCRQGLESRARFVRSADG